MSDNGLTITPQTVPMTERVVVVLESQRHVRICTSFERIWIIDSLEQHKHYDRQLASTRDNLAVPLSDVDWSTLDVVQMTHSYSSSSSRTSTVDYETSKLASSAVENHHPLRWKSILHFQRRRQNKSLAKAWWMLCRWMNHRKRLKWWTKKNSVLLNWSKLQAWTFQSIDTGRGYNISLHKSDFETRRVGILCTSS